MAQINELMLYKIYWLCYYDLISFRIQHILLDIPNSLIYFNQSVYYGGVSLIGLRTSVLIRRIPHPHRPTVVPDMVQIGKKD